jgi:uncharacterized protein (DUF1778 family)
VYIQRVAPCQQLQHARNDCKGSMFEPAIEKARLIRLGAERRGVNITSFILESACVRAEQEIADTRSFKLSAKDWRKFSESLDRPAQLKPRLKRLFSESTVLEES